MNFCNKVPNPKTTEEWDRGAAGAEAPPTSRTTHYTHQLHHVRSSALFHSIKLPSLSRTLFLVYARAHMWVSVRSCVRVGSVCICMAVCVPGFQPSLSHLIWCARGERYRSGCCGRKAAYTCTIKFDKGAPPRGLFRGCLSDASLQSHAQHMRDLLRDFKFRWF